MRLLKQQNAEARHRRYFLMFRSAALKKWQSQHSYRCVLDGSPIGDLRLTHTNHIVLIPRQEESIQAANSPATKHSPPLGG